MNEGSQIVVVGASGFGRESLDAIEAMQRAGTNIELLGVLDDSPSTQNLYRLKDRDVAYLGKIEDWIHKRQTNCRFVLAIGSPRVRKSLSEKLLALGLEPFTVIHPSAIIGTQTKIGTGSVICAGAVLSTNVVLDSFVHVNPGAIVGHDAILEKYVSINPGSIISGEVLVSSETLIGAGAKVLQGLTIGSAALVGAAALVTKDIPSNVTVTGIPGRWN